MGRFFYIQVQFNLNLIENPGVTFLLSQQLCGFSVEVFFLRLLCRHIKLFYLPSLYIRSQKGKVLFFCYVCFCFMVGVYSVLQQENKETGKKEFVKKLVYYIYYKKREHVALLHLTISVKSFSVYSLLHLTYLYLLYKDINVCMLSVGCKKGKIYSSETAMYIWQKLHITRISSSHLLSKRLFMIWYIT